MDDQLAILPRTYRPAHCEAWIQIDGDTQVQPVHSGPHIDDISDPFRIECGGGEVSRQIVAGSSRRCSGRLGAPASPLREAAQASSAHRRTTRWRPHRSLAHRRSSQILGLPITPAEQYGTHESGHSLDSVHSAPASPSYNTRNTYDWGFKSHRYPRSSTSSQNATGSSLIGKSCTDH